MSNDPRALALKGYPTIEVIVWEKAVDEAGNPTGYLNRVRTKTLSEVYAQLRQILGEYPDGGEEYFSLALDAAPGSEWPDGRIVCYSVNGTSEGDYTHVEVQIGRHTYGEILTVPIFVGKTFMGRDASWTFARLLADILEIQ